MSPTVSNGTVRRAIVRTRRMIYRGGNRVVSNDIRPRFGNISVGDANATEVHGKKLRWPCPLSEARPGDDYRVWHGASRPRFITLPP